MKQINNLEFIFPRLQETNYKIVLPETNRYNCLARANNDRSRWWHYRHDLTTSGINPFSIYWPSGVPRNGKVETIVLLFQLQGYAPCGSAEYESDFQKVAIYTDGLSGEYTHVAVMEKPSIWTSKLGKLDEIEHDNLYAVGGMTSKYGFVTKILKRPSDYCQK